MASTYLTRTPGSASNRRTYTWSGWFKRSNITDANILFEARIDNDNRFDFRFGSNEKILIYGEISNSNLVYLETSAVYRDPSAWYHIVVAVDTTQSTQSDRVKLYVNGSQITSFSTNTNNLSQNQETPVNTTNVHSIGANTTGGAAFDGYAAHVHFTDGYAYAASTFGSTSTNGQWVPNLAPSVTYGTNGYFLKFTNASDLGEDFSGNNNDYTKSGSGDKIIDNPQNVFATLNPLVSVSPKPSLSQGNLESTPTGNGNHTTGATMFIPENSGKWYAETVLTYVNNQSGAFAIQDADNIQASIATYSGQYSVLWQASGTDYYATHDGSSATNSTNATISVGDIFQIAYDSTNGKVWFGRNNTWITGNPSTDTSPTYSSITGNKVFTTTGYRVTSGSSYTAQLVNFGQDSSFAGNKTAQNNADANGEGDFYYAPPTGYKSLCTNNLSSSLTQPIGKGDSYFSPILYTGTGATQSITGVGFQPDLVWLKARTQSYYHNWYDIIRGGTKAIFSNSDVPEATDTGNLQTLDSDGFTADGFAGTNGSGVNYVAWNWLASNTTASNTDGTITSTVSVNQTSGFSVVTYTGTGANATVGHGLGKAPNLVIVKLRSGTGSWAVYSRAVGATKVAYLESTTAFFVNSSFWNNTDPTSSVFSLGSEATTNTNGGTLVAYCFADIEGYSKTGTYIGNASTDGPFIYTGFKPSWVMIKRIDGANGWNIFDSVRNPTNVVEKQLFANSTAIEEADVSHNAARDYLSNGFKIRETGNDVNVNGSSYLYMAFAENPFVDSSGIPVTAQ